MSPVERRIGLHLVRREPPDLLVLMSVGDIDGEHANAILAEMHELGKSSSAVFILMDVSQLGHILPEARAAATNSKTGLKTEGIAFIGAGFHHRVLVSLIVRASALIRNGSLIPTAFFEAEAEARAWIEERRRSLAQKPSE